MGMPIAASQRPLECVSRGRVGVTHSGAADASVLKGASKTYGFRIPVFGRTLVEINVSHL